jgi:hypothetical protein
LFSCRNVSSGAVGASAKEESEDRFGRWDLAAKRRADDVFWQLTPSADGPFEPDPSASL